MYVLKFLSVMLSMIVADAAWTYYFIKVEERKSVPAGLWASAITLAGAFVTVNYVNDRTLLIAALIGSFLGTYLSVERNKNKKE
jgi:hypothetical protein